MANRKGVLYIPCENMAAWMSINNTFARSAIAGNRQGIMVQLGDRRRHNSPYYMRRFESIVFKGKNGRKLKVLPRRDFGGRARERVLWINVFPSRHDNPVSMPKSDKNLEILKVKSHRSLRTYFKPVAHLICWHAPSGVKITAKPHKDFYGHGYVHNSYTFELGGVLDVQIVLDTDNKIILEYLPQVYTITVSTEENGSVPDDGGDDGNGEDPPQQRKP